tara:strand:- start:27050 stop:29083 length:2034 start_codon:yes stop_codon:yes gene_type:complete
MLIEEQSKILNEFKPNCSVILAFTETDVKTIEVDSQNYIYLLNDMPVTKRSKFRDVVWDYNDDVINPGRNIAGSKLCIDFSKYTNIPAFVLIELKCLMHNLTLAPTRYSVSSKRAKPLKYNTIITHFENGLRLLSHTFSKINEIGEEFVAVKYKAISDILESDFRDAAEDYPFTANRELERFFYYLKHPATKKIIEHDIQIDFDSLKFPIKRAKKLKKPTYLENDKFEVLIEHSVYRVVEFLKLMGTPVEDKTALTHFENLKNNFEPLSLSPDLINDYGIIRLLSKGYSKEFIDEKYKISPLFINEEGGLYPHENIRIKAKSLHKVEHFDKVRKQINEIYYAACFIVGIYTGMRPNALSEIIISKCLITEDGHDLLISKEHKGKAETLKLFDDKWVAIPIIKDAIAAAKIIGKFKNNDYLFSNMDTLPATIARNHENMGSGGIKHFMENYFMKVFGEGAVKDINFNAYMLRHTLAYQLFRADLGLPFISFQLKHIVDQVGSYTSVGATNDVTMSYGGIGEQLSDTKFGEIRKSAEVERVKSVMNPDATYLGPKGKEHKDRLKRAFEGYMAAGYTKEEVYNQMADQGMAIVNMGTGFCFGGVENFDESLPCIGSLRCNPIRCNNAVVTKSHAPKWREVYVSNKALLNKKGYEDRQDQISAAMNEAESVLKHLGEELIL